MAFVKSSAALLAALVAATISVTAGQQRPAAFQLEETTIARIHAAMKAGQLTCRGLVEQYLRRIEAYDKAGPALNAIVVVNPEALAEADELDRRAKQGAFAGPLHCIPTIVKDNFETIGLQSAAGSLSLKGFVSNRDAFQVRRIKAAGAIVLAKSNMAEFAFTPYETVSSILPGYTKNPYALDRVTAGSSGGTAAAVAANFGAIGLGSDTGNSIRGPASHQALAGIRSTMGLTSRTGVVPLNLLADIAGPMTRTLEDAVAVLQVIAGPDPDDPVTVAESPIARSFSPGGHPATIPNYLAALKKDGLKGRRIGILRQAYERDTTDAEIVKVFHGSDRRPQSAPVPSSSIPCVSISIEARRPQGAGTCGGFKYDINRWLASHGERHPGEEPRRDHPVAAVSPDRAAAPRTVTRGHRERSRHAGVPGRSRVPRAGARGGAQDHGRGNAGRVRVSDVEQPATTDRRSEHAARRQQPVLLADDGLPVDQRADGLHARQAAAGRHDFLRPRVGRAA